MEIEVGSLDSKIITDNPDIIKALCPLYEFKEKGAEYTVLYKRGLWNGKKKFMSKDGKFKTGLLEDVLEKLAKIECYPKLNYNLEDSEEFTIEDIPGFDYYDYQEALIKQALEKKRCIIDSPTGSGKTLIMAGIVKALKGKKGVILFHQKQILTQTYEFFTEECGLEGIGINFGEGYIYGDVILSTVQSIEKILDTHLEDSDFIMVDEVHEFSSGKTRLAAIESFPSAKIRIGLTATVPENKVRLYNILGALGPVVKECSTRDLMDQGVLSESLVQIIPIDYGHDMYYDGTPYRELYDKYITNNEFRNDTIRKLVEKANKDPKNKPLIIVQSLKHGEILEELIPGAKYINGSDNLSIRYKVIDKFLKGEYSCLIGTIILQTGIDIKQITHFINARGLKAREGTLQALGRSLRKSEISNKVYIYDFWDQVPILTTQYKTRLKNYKKEGHEIKIVTPLKYEEKI